MGARQAHGCGEASGAVDQGTQNRHPGLCPLLQFTTRSGGVGVGEGEPSSKVGGEEATSGHSSSGDSSSSGVSA